MPIIAKAARKVASDLKQMGSALNRAETSALNRTSITVRKVSDQSIRKRLNLKSRDVKNSIRVNRASAGNNRIGLAVRVVGIPVRTTATSKPHYKGRQTAKGVTFKPFKNRGRQLIRSAFAHENLANNRVFKRVGKARLPIKNIWGPTIAGEFERNRVQFDMDQAWAENINKNLRASEAFFLRRYGFTTGSVS